jgi:tRNA modification GTPase
VFAADDTIVAIATPLGRGGLGVIRISGPRALEIGTCLTDRTAPLAPRQATFTQVRWGDTTDLVDGDAARDEAIVTWFPAPKSYTGDDVVEISAHGAPVVLHGILALAIRRGARLARPGEFTLRAFLNGKRDLVRAEAVADLIDAATPLQARMAYDQLQGTLTGRIQQIDLALLDLLAKLEASIDFPDEGYKFITPVEAAAQLAAIVAEIDNLLADADRGRLIREGATVVIVGRPNAGKSSIFNMLLGQDRAIVTAVPGTTRDLVSERVDIEGIPVTLVDTAGARDTTEIVEREGVARGKRARAIADVLLVVLDSSEPLTADDHDVLAQTSGQPRIVVANKADLPTRCFPAARESLVFVSTLEGRGCGDLRAALARALGAGEARLDAASISNVRHIGLLREARGSVSSAHAAAAVATPEEFVVADLIRARRSLAEMSGASADDDVLNRIFERFCVGK